MMFHEQTIKPGQKLALIKLAERFVNSRDERLYLISKLLDRPVASTNDLTIGDWQTIRNMAYPNWPDDDWSIALEFSSRAQDICRNFQTQVLGQLTLFGD